MTTKLITRHLGVVSYQDGLSAQKEAYSLVQKEPTQGILTICEHWPVVTLGRHSSTSSLLVSIEELQRQKIDCHRSDRGGDATVHFPGQLVVYIAISLKSLRLGVKSFVRKVEDSVITVLGRYQIVGTTLGKYPGIWLARGDNRYAKICALGFTVKKSITSHGLALNITEDTSLFSLIKPCGIDHDSLRNVTSMMTEIRSNPELNKGLTASQMKANATRDLILSLEQHL